MLYTLTGGLLGLTLSYCVCKLTNVNMQSNNGYFKLPSEGQILMFLGTIMGASMGFGIGAYKIAHQSYP